MLRYEQGEGTSEPDDKGALRFYNLAAKKGDHAAMYSLGRFFAEGRGLSKNESIAVGWLMKAANGGHVESMLAVATHYENGYGVDRDLVAAVNLLEDAAAIGSAEAMIRHD